MTTTIDKVDANYTTPVNENSRIKNYRQHLRAITKGLIEMAQAAGRKHFTSNQLLRECYQQVDAEFHTFDEWNSLGAHIRKGEHAYLFWGEAVTHPTKGYKYNPVQFLFSREQVIFKEEYK